MSERIGAACWRCGGPVDSGRCVNECAVARPAPAEAVAALIGFGCVICLAPATRDRKDWFCDEHNPGDYEMVPKTPAEAAAEVDDLPPFPPPKTTRLDLHADCRQRISDLGAALQQARDTLKDYGWPSDDLVVGISALDFCHGAEKHAREQAQQALERAEKDRDWYKSLVESARGKQP